MAHNPWPLRAATRTAVLPEAPFRPQCRGVPEAHGRARPPDRSGAKGRRRAPSMAGAPSPRHLPRGGKLPPGGIRPGAIILTPAQAYGAKLLL